MSHSIAEAPVCGARTARDETVSRWVFALELGAFLLLWLEIVSQLQSEWSLNPQYSYGWTVPFLAAWLFYQRWLRRPDPLAPRHPGLTITIAIFAAAIFFPGRLIAVANPDWRLLSWTMALVAVALSFCGLELAGGSSWRRHFTFPVVFFLIATPWPVQLEQFVVQSLMRADTAITIQLLNIIGTIALQHGNVIELSTGQVGIDDACTGVRSLQATFMIALFLGEFYWLARGRRVLLLLAGALLAFFCNIGRTFLLCEVAATSGISAIERWHDPAGFTILVVCLFLLWGLSLRLKRSPNECPVRTQTRSTYGTLWLPLGLIGWIALTEIAVAAWYMPTSAQKVQIAPWSVAWPTDEPDFHRQPIPETAALLLRFNEGGAATWRAADGRPWMMYSFRWFPGRTAALFVKNHRPDICLPASGLTMEQESRVHLVNVNGVRLPIRRYRFDDRGHPLHIFYCYWDGRSSDANDAEAAAEDWTARGRLRAAWQGKRELGAHMFELAVWGYENEAEAHAALQRELEKIVKRG
ncbi:MAG TPA: exosortase/archaeosortase family protein [Chthoniobacterales bacterium]